VVRGGVTDAVGGVSGTGTFSGGDASATLVSLAADGILKGGDGVSNNNHGANAFVRGGIAAGGGTHGRVQLDTAGVGRWQVTNSGHLLAVADDTYDIGADGATRPRTGYFGTSAVIGADFHRLTSTQVGFFGAALVAQPVDMVALTDSTGGTANDTVVAVAGTGDDATINDNFSDLTAKINTIRTTLRDLGLMA